MSDAVAVLPMPAAEISGQNTNQNDGRFRVGNPHRWRKGMASPNPGGRPKKLALSEALEEILDQRLPDNAEGQRIHKRFLLRKNATWAQAIAAAMVRRALKSTEACAEIADRVEGKARQRLELAGLDEIVIRVVYEDSPMPA